MNGSTQRFVFRAASVAGLAIALVGPTDDAAAKDKPGNNEISKMDSVGLEAATKRGPSPFRSLRNKCDALRVQVGLASKQGDLGNRLSTVSGPQLSTPADDLYYDLLFAIDELREKGEVLRSKRVGGVALQRLNDAILKLSLRAEELRSASEDLNGQGWQVHRTEQGGASWGKGAGGALTGKTVDGTGRIALRRAESALGAGKG